jgi:hypothetical protein
MLLKILSLGVSGLVSLTLLGWMPSGPQAPDEPLPPRKKGLPFPRGKEAAKKKGEAGPAGDLHRAYNLLRRLRADGQTAGRPEARIRDWTERATTFYREGIKALQESRPQLAHEYGAIAHDLARAIEHARNAMLYDRPDEDLPPPPGRSGADRDEDARQDLTRAYERLRDSAERRGADSDARYYHDAASDLYRAARRDFDANRLERAGELARAAEAMTHVVEHLGHAADVRIAPAPKTKTEPQGRPEFGHRGPDDFRGGDLPPPPPPE